MKKKMKENKNGTLHICKFNMTDIGECEIVITNEVGIPPRFSLKKVDTNETLCVISILFPRYLKGTKIHLNDIQKKELIDACNSEIKYPRFDGVNAVYWDIIPAGWMSNNEKDYDYKFDKMPNYMLLP